MLSLGPRLLRTCLLHIAFHYFSSATKGCEAKLSSTVGFEVSVIHKFSSSLAFLQTPSFPPISPSDFFPLAISLKERSHQASVLELCLLPFSTDGTFLIFSAYYVLLSHHYISVQKCFVFTGCTNNNFCNTPSIDCQVLTLGCQCDNYCLYFDLEFITKYSGH